jgi:hypothetical protein
MAEWIESTKATQEHYCISSTGGTNLSCADLRYLANYAASEICQISLQPPVVISF